MRVPSAQGFQFRIAAAHHGSRPQPAAASGGNEERENSKPGERHARLADGPLGRVKECYFRIAATCRGG
jgi:hypothetical protein